MKNNWIHKPITDYIFILFPSFISVIFVFIFQNKFNYWEEKYSFFNWLILIVFIDVAHVYSTLYKTYFNPKEREKRFKLLVILPIFALISSLFLYQFGANFYWSIMAYIAVFHFVKQQYGFMKLYSRNELYKICWLDNLCIYNATLFPMLFWFLSPKRNFTWFTENEFISYESPNLIFLLKFIYYIIIIIYIFYLFWNWNKHKYFNFQKISIILGTYFTWYFGIVYFNNDLIFTLLNVVAHGVPYIALIYFNQRKEKHDFLIPKLTSKIGLIFFIGILLMFALTEEFLWEYTVWNEHIHVHQFINPFEKWHWVLVPLLTVPQLTHYILDGYIWKSK